MAQPLVSVCIITYNHDRFLRQAIEGVLAQMVDFEYEIIIADDCSLDNTRKIILEYKEKFPSLFKTIFQEKNVGAAQNWSDLLAKPKGKYIAYFEGDDYWTDVTKLQKQINFLEKNMSFSCCFHPVEILPAHENDWFSYPIPPRDELSFLQILNDHYIPSSSLVFRNYSWLKSLPSFYSKAISGDIPLELMLACEGKFKFINIKMSCYRRNISSVTQKRKSPSEISNGYYWMYLQLSKHMPIKYTFLVFLKALKYKLTYYKYKLLHSFSNVFYINF